MERGEYNRRKRRHEKLLDEKRRKKMERTVYFKKMLGDVGEDRGWQEGRGLRGNHTYVSRLQNQRGSPDEKTERTFRKKRKHTT